MSTFWRAAKLSYLEYVNHSSSAVRAALKEPLRSKAAVRGKVHLRERWYEGGVPGESKYFFVSLNDALHYMLQKAMPGGPSMLDFVLTWMFLLFFFLNVFAPKHFFFLFRTFPTETPQSTIVSTIKQAAQKVVA